MEKYIVFNEKGKIKEEKLLPQHMALPHVNVAVETMPAHCGECPFFQHKVISYGSNTVSKCLFIEDDKWESFGCFIKRPDNCPITNNEEDVL